MKITVSRKGEKLGPYTVGEINARLLAGELKLHDWAWPEGATDWLPLGSIAGVGHSSPIKPPPRINRRVVIWAVVIVVFFWLLNKYAEDRAAFDNRMQDERWKFEDRNREIIQGRR